MTATPLVPERAPAVDRTDRQVSLLISLGGVALIVGQAVPMIAGAETFAPWWNALAMGLLLQVLIFAAFGWALPPRVLRAGWLAAPALNAALLTFSYAAYRGPLPVVDPPWPWAFESALVSYLVLVVRPLWAVAATVGSALLPMLSAAVFLGDVPHVVLVDTPIHLANVIYIALFTGIRARLNQLRAAEARVLAAESQRIQAQVSARDKEQLARLIHDEVLSVFAAATKFRGDPPSSLRANASHALDLFERPSTAQATGTSTTGRAADRIEAALRQIDTGISLDRATIPGEVHADVVESVAAAATEALRNSVRHAATAERTVGISVAPARIEVTVRDDGNGFDVDRVGEHRLGIRNSIVERMRALPGGGATVESTPGAGTRVRVTWQI